MNNQDVESERQKWELKTSACSQPHHNLSFDSIGSTTSGETDGLGETVAVDWMEWLGPVLARCLLDPPLARYEVALHEPILLFYHGPDKVRTYGFMFELFLGGVY